MDEAHAIGVYGQNGLGIAERDNLIAEIDLLVGTFGKALASVGAYAVCNQVLKECLINQMRPLIFQPHCRRLMWLGLILFLNDCRNSQKKEVILSS